MRLQGAIFDMDGTLLDSMKIWDNMSYNLLKELGYEPEEDLNEKLKNLSLMQAAEYCRRQYRMPQTARQIVELVDRRADRFYRECVEAKPGVERFLSLLKMESVWMYVATATDRPQAEAGLRRTGLDRYFRGILTCTEVGHGKDEPVIFEKCLTRLRCLKRDCVVFEDSLHAIRTAKAAGFRVAGVYDPAFEAEQEEIRSLCDYYIRDYGDWVSSDADGL